MRRLPGLALVLLLPWSAAACAADSAEELQKKAAQALQEGKADEAVRLAGMAVALEPKKADGYFFRGQVYERLQKHAEAIQDFDTAVELKPDLADAYQFRGAEHFKLGHIRQSLADFDKYLELRPDQRPGHWQRGITLYYAGQFDEGARQFARYEAVTKNDVENAVWHYLCVARKSGEEEARKSLLKIGHDRRVPLMQVYDLFKGKATPEDVLAAVREGSPDPKELRMRQFYAHLYLGLYAEARGDKKKALEFMKQAADEAPTPHYMGDVARVHRDILLKEVKP